MAGKERSITIMKQHEIVITVDFLEKAYKNHKVLKGISFTVTKGTIFALLGSNGAGKTTTIHLLSTLMKPDGGNAAICGFDIVRQSDKVREHISLTGQYAAVDELLTGKENLRMVGALRHLTDNNKKADELLELFHLTNAANRRVSTYSGGMRRRLDLAMSLLGNPAIIFLDEPTTGLDPQSRLSLWKIIRNLADSGTTIFLTTQYLEEAEQLADHIAILHNGMIAAEGTPDGLKEKLSHEMVELTFYNENEMKKAYELLKEHQVNRNEEMLTINIITDGSVKQLADILNLLNTTNISLSGFTQKSPTLEDIFLKLIDENKGEKDK